MSELSTRPLPDGAALVGGDRIARTSRGCLEHVDPSTGKVQGELVLSGTTEVDMAVRAAADAGARWRALPGASRRDALLRIADVLVRHAEELAAIRSRETGIPFRVPSPGLAVDWFRYYAGWADKITGQTLEGAPAAFAYTTLEPYGVVAALVPWNAPIDSIAMKVAPALAAGNAIVLKPSELAPFAATRFGELCLEAGLPPGVVNVLPGDGATGAALVDHRGLGKITFTGGAATARHVLASAAQRLTPVVVELGGKSANIVFADADLDRAAETAVFRGIVALSGQACVLPTRLLVHADVHDAVAARVLALVKSVSIGRPFDTGVQMGPVINESACERITGIVERARASRSGSLLCGGGRLGGELADGFFVEPTVIGDVEPDSEVATEEIFGPVLAITRFDDEEEAVEIANGTRYGLGGFLFTGDLARAHRVAAALEAGSVGVNGFPPMQPGAPFGGVKESGFGREGGQAGLLEFLRPKSVHVDLGGTP